MCIAVSCQEMKARIGSQNPMSDRASWVFWDGEWKKAWRPAVALTAGTAEHGSKRPGGAEGCCDKSRKESSVSAAVLTPSQDILYPPSNDPKSIRFQSFFIRPGLGGGRLFFRSIIIWRLQKIEEELGRRIFSITVPRRRRFDVH